MATILVADDNQLYHDHLMSILKDSGYDILNAYDGNQCLEMVRRYKPDLILLDLNIPPLNGHAVAIHLLADNNTTPIIMLSDCIEHEHAIQAWDEGVKQLVSRPVVREELLSAIADALPTS